MQYAGECLAWIGLTQQGFAHKESVDTGLLQLKDILTVSYAGFADNNASFGDQW